MVSKLVERPLYVLLFCLVTLQTGMNIIAADPDLTVEFGQRESGNLKMDIYFPSDSSSDVYPAIVWVHGGAWRKGSRQSVPIAKLTKHGYVVASVDYRLSPVAKFPAQVIDIREAIQHLHDNASKFRVSADQISIAGASAGGHLAALVGVSSNVPFEQSKELRVDLKAIVSFYGASNLNTILAQSTPHGLSVRVPALKLLLGAKPEENADLAESASPVSHVDRGDPPLFLLHGDQDPQMPINQAHELHGVYKANGLSVKFEVIHGAAHGGSEFYSDEMLARVNDFLRSAIN